MATRNTFHFIQLLSRSHYLHTSHTRLTNHEGRLLRLHFRLQIRLHLNMFRCETGRGSYTSFHFPPIIHDSHFTTSFLAWETV